LQGLDTPTLLGIWETGPYLHDGSAATVLEVITTANAEDKHGRTSQLSQREKEQLTAFLLQLDQGPLPAGTRPGGRPVLPRRARLQTLPGVGMVRIVLSGWDESRPRLTVWDGKGRAVKIFRAEEMRRESSGAWTALWQGRDARGLATPRGVYLVRAGSGALSATTTLPWIP
jgi:hypothetical protein